MFIAIWRVLAVLRFTMLADDEDCGEVSTSGRGDRSADQLINDIHQIASRLATLFPLYSLRWEVQKPGRLRIFAWPPFNREPSLTVWRIYTTGRPLWLGADGVIYRAFSKHGTFHWHDRANFVPDRWKPSMLEDRDLEGLETLKCRLLEMEERISLRLHCDSAL
jgi:hypothetical protein